MFSNICIYLLLDQEKNGILLLTGPLDSHFLSQRMKMAHSIFKFTLYLK